MWYRSNPKDSLHIYAEGNQVIRSSKCLCVDDDRYMTIQVRRLCTLRKKCLGTESIVWDFKSKHLTWTHMIDALMTKGLMNITHNLVCREDDDGTRICKIRQPYEWRGDELHFCVGEEICNGGT